MCIVSTAITVPNVHRDIMDYIAQEYVIKTVSIALQNTIVKSVNLVFTVTGVIVVVHNV